MKPEKTLCNCETCREIRSIRESDQNLDETIIEAFHNLNATIEEAGTPGKIALLAIAGIIYAIINLVL